MDKAKKEMLNRYKKMQRESFEAALPMPKEYFRQLMDYLEQQEESCNGNLDRTIAYLEENHCAVSSVAEWLRQNGAGCDCEVLCNIAEQLDL